VHYAYLIGEKIYPFITNSISNIQEPISKKGISCTHVFRQMKGVGMKQWPKGAHAKAGSNLMGISATQHNRECLAPVPTQNKCFASKWPGIFAYLLEKTINHFKCEAM
jgi:hypothetical protein